jgi:hypothetical protein
MLTTLALAALLAGQPRDDVAPLLFDTISPKAAAALHGQRVTITFTPALPAYTWGKGKRLVTVADPADIDDVERSVFLKGNRMLDADESRERLTVRGTLRVIYHPPSVINGTTFEGFTEVRVEE